MIHVAVGALSTLLFVAMATIFQVRAFIMHASRFRQHCAGLSMASCIIVKVVELCVAMPLLMLPCLQMGDMETDPTTKYRLAVGHSKVEVIGFLVKFFMTACSVFINNTVRLLMCCVPVRTCSHHPASVLQAAATPRSLHP